MFFMLLLPPPRYDSSFVSGKQESVADNVE